MTESEILLRMELEPLVIELVEQGVRCWRWQQSNSPHLAPIDCPDCRDEAWRYIKIVRTYLLTPPE